MFPLPQRTKTNEFAKDFIGLPIPAGHRFSNVLVSEFNAANNPTHTFVFNKGTPQEAIIESPDLGRAMVTGQLEAPVPLLDQVNSFKISPLRGIKNTAPYFHDNSAKTLEDVAAHYARFFSTVTAGGLVLTEQDQADIVAYMKLLK